MKQRLTFDLLKRLRLYKDVVICIFSPVQPTKIICLHSDDKKKRQAHAQMCHSPRSSRAHRSTAFSSPESSSTVKPEETHENTHSGPHSFRAAALIRSIKSSGTCNPPFCFRRRFAASVRDNVPQRVVNGAHIAAAAAHI